MDFEHFIAWRELRQNNQLLAQLGSVPGQNRGGMILWYGDAPMLEMPQHHQMGTPRMVGKLQGRSCWVEEAAIIASLGELPQPPSHILLWVYYRISTALDALHRAGIGHGHFSPFSIGISETGDPILIGVTGTSTPVADRSLFVQYWNLVSDDPMFLRDEALYHQLPEQKESAELLLKFAQKNLPRQSTTFREMEIELIHHIHAPLLDEFDKEDSEGDSSTGHMEKTLNPERTAELTASISERPQRPRLELDDISQLSTWLHRDIEALNLEDTEPCHPKESFIFLAPLLPPNGVLLSCWPTKSEDDDWEQTATIMVTQSKTVQHKRPKNVIIKKKGLLQKNRHIIPYVVGTMVITFIFTYLLSLLLRSLI